jgi:iron(III) transport system permease protein
LTALGIVVTVVERRRAGRALGSLTTLAFAIPGSTVAIGLLIAYGRWLSSGLLLIFLAYVVKFSALTHRTTSAVADRIPPAEWQAARISGASWPVAGTTIWLPAMGPALLGSWLLVFVAALHEVTMSSLLYSIDNQTLAVAVLNSEELGDVGRTAALSVMLTLMILSAALIAVLLIRNSGRLQAAARRQRARVDVH